MLQTAKDFFEDTSLLMDSQSCEEMTSSFINFCEQMGTVSEVKDFLLILKAQIPKKFKTGELLLFYESQQFGLRRAYIRNADFYEEEAQNIWPHINQISLSSVKENSYLAEEFGRPFSKNLMVPLQNSKQQTTALLFVEMNQWTKLLEPLKLFFEKRKFILNLIFERSLSNTGFTRISYLWSQLFTYWWEPLAIIQNFKVIRHNDSFRKILSEVPDFLKKKNFSGSIEIGKKIYQIYYYPIFQFKDLKSIGILYCQDMTKHFYLKEQLFQSEKMAELYELGKNMAHQLNNPLAGIKSMSQIFFQNPELENFQEEFSEIEKAVKRSQKIIETLLSFSNIQKEYKTCNLNQVIEDTLPLLKSMMKGLSFNVDLCKQALEVKADFSVLQQVTYNLILNACQALNEDKNNKQACIQIKTDFISKNKAYLKVIDNGPGIKKQNLEKIFQAFWTSKKQGKGTGLGLGIAKRFVEEFGGKIFVSSKEKDFTCFTVLLPLHDFK